MDFKRLMAGAPHPPVKTPLKPLTTPWGDALDPEAVLPRHPHPQCAREAFRLLNGSWSYRFIGAEDPWPPSWDGAAAILVPFSPESLLSGVGRQLQPDELLVYRRTFATPALGEDDRLILHFEAVDYVCDVYVNGYRVGSHRGAYLPFSFDITDYLARGAGSGAEGAGDDAVEGASADAPAGAPADAAGGPSAGPSATSPENELIVVVADPSDAGTQLRGKQRLARGGIWYTAQSGIWQSVWLETVPAVHIRKFTLRPDADRRTLTIEADCAGVAPLAVEVGAGVIVAENCDYLTPTGAPIAQASATHGRRLTVTLPEDSFERWSPERPVLYPVTLRFGDDVIHSYTAFRTVCVRADNHGNGRFFLNDAPLFVRGVLDQGYWSDGLMTAPADEALIFDIEAARDAGFNLLRKHIKVESDRYYFHCDRLGMLVMQDMVCGGGTYRDLNTSYLPTFFRFAWGHYPDDVPNGFDPLGAGDQRYREEWIETCRGTVRWLGHHPSIVAWTVFNEGWGQFRAVEATEMVARLDPTRPIDATSGWYDQRCGDFRSVHNYFRELEVYPDYFAAAGRHRAFFISEFGGFTWHVPDHSALDTAYGYANFDCLLDWQLGVEGELALCDDLEEKGLAGFVYTQLSDVEEETNGILTYDRRVNKLNAPE